MRPLVLPPLVLRPNMVRPFALLFAVVLLRPLVPRVATVLSVAVLLRPLIAVRLRPAAADRAVATAFASLWVFLEAVSQHLKLQE